METTGTKKAGAVPGLFLRLGALLLLMVVAAVNSPAQTSVEDRIAALEVLLHQQNARIQQLEQELAVSKGEVKEVSAPVANDVRPFIRRAVLVSSGPTLTVAPAEVAEPAAAAVPPQQASGDFSGNFEGLNFFKGTKFSGFLESYYGYDFNKPGSRKVNYRNFDFNHNSLTLSQVMFDISKPASESSPLGYMLQLHFGPTADLVSGGDFTTGNSTAAHFLQYYLSGRVPVGKGLTIDVGKFVTQHGAEVIDSRADINLSRSLLFAWAIPYYHFGVRATYPASDKVTLAAYLVNGWNNVIENNGGKTGGFQLVWNPSSRFSLIQNYMVGPEQTDDNDNIRHLLDTTITAKLDPKGKATFMANFDYGLDRVTGSGDSVHWIGAAGYLRLSPSSWFSLTPRFEWFFDQSGFTTGTRQQLKEITITPEFLIGEHVVTRLEYRRDWSNADTFSRGPAETGFSQATAAAGVILKF